MSYHFSGSADLHNITLVDLAAVPSAPQRHLRMLNALSYHNQPINKVLKDIIVQQAHAGCGAQRNSPVADTGLNQWTPSGGGSRFSCVDDKIEIVPAFGSDYVSSVLPNATERWTLKAVPANATNVQEAIAQFWMELLSGGTETGLAILARLGRGGAAFSRDQLLESIPGASAGTAIELIDVKFDRLNQTPVQWNATSYLEVVSKVGAAGGAPLYTWLIYTAELLVYYEIGDISVVNTAAFDALDATFSTYVLDFSLWEGKWGEIVLDVMQHEPTLQLHVDYLSRLTPTRMGKLGDAVSPIDISTHVKAVRDHGWYTERKANVIAIKYDATWNASTDVSDPVVVYPDRGQRRIRKPSSSMYSSRRYEPVEHDRPYIRTTALATDYIEKFFKVWGLEIEFVQLACHWGAAVVEPNLEDEVVVTLHRQGIDTSRRWHCVGKDFDLDRDEVILTLFAVEYSP